MQERMSRLYGKWSLAVAVQPIVLLVVALKFVFFRLGLEVFTLSPLLSGVIAANVFLLGFLISGVLVDYKESERLPGELTASLSSILDEVSYVHRRKPSEASTAVLAHLFVLAGALRLWFYKKERTHIVMDQLGQLSDLVANMGEDIETGAVGRIKSEQSALRRTLVRIRTIRGTYFVPTGYAVAEATNIIVIVALWITEIQRIFESLFFVGLIAFLTTYMLQLIRRLDNPFDYYSREKGVDEVSLQPLEELQERLKDMVVGLGGEGTFTPGKHLVPGGVPGSVSPAAPA